MTIANIISLLGGIALFLFGMSLMGDSLKKVAGSKLELILYKLSSNAFKGILLGTGVTAVIQSSSATSVMVVGFVNSGMMKTKQALGVVLGSILGTSITGWVLCLNSISGGKGITSLLSTAVITGIFALVGIILWMFCKKTSQKNLGGILLGFAVLMYGMSAMSQAVAPLKESAEFVSILTKFSNPFLGILVGIVVTAILQSASASVGILQALAVTGAISFDVALPVIMGMAIGAAVPVLISSIGALVAGKRTAFGYLLFNVLGTIICGIVFYVLNGIFEFSFMSTTMDMVGIALLNTIFRFATLIILAPMIGLIEKLVGKLFKENPDDKAMQADMDRLEERFIRTPAVAVEQSRLVINSMANLTKESVNKALELERQYDEKGFKKLISMEKDIDRYEDKLGIYLSKLTGIEMNKEQSIAVSEYLHVLSDFERISDHARNIGESVEELHEKKKTFSSQAQKELDGLTSAINEIVSNTVDAFILKDVELAKRTEPLEEVIDDLCDTMKVHHIDRVRDGVCSIEDGFIFNDMLTDFERISDHCSNIAVAIIETNKPDIAAHEYLHEEAINGEGHFREYFEEYETKYKL